MTTHVFNLKLKLTLSATICTLESKMFKEMRNTVRLIRFCPATSIYPYPTGSGLGIWGIFGCNLVITKVNNKTFIFFPLHNCY